MYRTLRVRWNPGSSGAPDPYRHQVGHGLRPVATRKIFTQGDYQQTDSPLDLVIEGGGFFQICCPAVPPHLGRAFKVDSNGLLVTSDGFVLEPEVQIPPTPWISPSAPTGPSLC